MTRIFNTADDFVDQALNGFARINARYVRRIDGGVVRSTTTPVGQVAVVIGGGSGHYPAFAGLVGPGLAAGAVCGQVFTSPSAAHVYKVAKTADRGGGVLLSYGNYAGDVLHFGHAQERLRAEGVDVRTVLVTDDIASASIEHRQKRRGIAGDFVVFKIASAAAEAGADLDDVERLAIAANDRTRTLGVAFDGCTLPGAGEPLFGVPAGQMSIGLGIHGEPGISDAPLASSAELARFLVEKLVDELPDGVQDMSGQHVSAIVNGLGTVKYEELFVLYNDVARELEARGVEIIEPECGELVTSLDMAGVSLTLVWLDEELEALWKAPADSPAYTKGATAAQMLDDGADRGDADSGVTIVIDTASLVAVAPLTVDLIGAARDVVVEHAAELGRIDAFAGDGDHGTGMSRGLNAAYDAAADAVDAGGGAANALEAAGAAWSEQAGGTSGALWGAALEAAAARLRADADSVSERTAVGAVVAAADAITSLGKAELGDKTMVDALTPFVDALRANTRDADLATAWGRAAVVAEDAAAATAQLSPKLGRARPLAERSVGHPDAGATSLALIVTAIGHKLNERE